MNLTNKIIDKLTSPEKGKQKRYYDDEVKGFGLRITSGGTRSFFVEAMVNGKQKRFTISHYPNKSAEEARKKAKKYLSKMEDGIDPIAEKKEQQEKSITLRQAFDDYLNVRKNLKATTVTDYHRVLKQVVNDWLDKPLLSITKDKVAKRHTEHGEQKSQARANLAMRLLRAIFNFAMGQYEDAKGRALVLENPVKRLSHTRSWYRIDRRQNIIKSHELKQWYDGLQNFSHHFSPEKGEMLKDYFMLVLLTGLRREEAARLQWRDVDFKSKIMTIPETKNNSKHTMPLSDYLYDLLQRRKQSKINDYVFPADSATGHLADPRKALLQVRKLSGIEFTIHDLRRTFITIAESLDIPVYALKRLLNHKMTADVTAGYVIMDVERLRKPMQMIADYILKLMGIKKTIKIVNINDIKMG